MGCDVRMVHWIIGIEGLLELVYQVAKAASASALMFVHGIVNKSYMNPLKQREDDSFVVVLRGDVRDWMRWRCVSG